MVANKHTEKSTGASGNKVCHVLLAVMTLMTLLGSAAAVGDELSPAVTSETSVNADSNTTGATTQSMPPLKGRVEKVELSLEKLRDVGLDLKNVLKAASSLYDEVTIQPVRLITEPEVVGRGIVINIPIGTVPVGPPQPARKDRVDLAMAGITPIITMMKNNVDEFMAGNSQLNLPQDVIEELQPDLKDWTSMVED
ncbi:MAG: hypothetical protein HY711_07945, partial [Candidatus Melainabacteria bacterium]|nr:hypothetical protein [Candidatus Melainabacteria bacterium]